MWRLWSSPLRATPFPLLCGDFVAFCNTDLIHERKHSCFVGRSTICIDILCRSQPVGEFSLSGTRSVDAVLEDDHILPQQRVI